MTGRLVRVRRTGGFAGLSRSAEADADDDPELAELVDRVDVSGLEALPTTHADRYTFAFDLCGTEVTVPEQHLTDDLRRIADVVLRSGRGSGQGPVEGGGDVE